MLIRALEDAKAWRNGYAMLAGGLSALLGFIGTRLDNDTGAVWRAALTVLLGGGLLCVVAALAMVLTIEGGRRRVRLNLREIVARHNSLQAYQALQASAALQRLDLSKKVAGIGAALAFAGLLVTLWMPGADKETSAPTPAPAATSSAPPETRTRSVVPAPQPSATVPQPVNPRPQMPR